MKNSEPIFLSNVKFRIWTFLFYKKKPREKDHFFKISKDCYYLLGDHRDIIFGLFWDI